MLAGNAGTAHRAVDAVSGPRTQNGGGQMIVLTRLNGHAFALNPDLIERAESTPDTVITLVDGKK